MNRTIAVLLVAIVLLVGVAASQPPLRTVRVGVLEGGDYTPHGYIRQSLRESLDLLKPKEVSIVFDPELTRSAGWDRLKCKEYARALSQSKSIDMVLAFGPWVVEDLLEAGFQKPIIAIYQTAPLHQGLVDSTARPASPQLTVTFSPGNIRRELTALTRLTAVRKLGVLYFPSGDEAPKLIAEVSAVGKELGFETVTAEGYNNVGTYAFFKAYSLLDPSVDAVYILPMWGMDGDKIREFAERITSDGRPSFTTESRYAVERGMFASGTAPSLAALGRFNAWKIVQIVNGRRPADLPTILPDEPSLTINEKTAQRLRIEIPLELIAQADILATSTDPTAQPLSVADAVQRALDQNPGYLAKYDAISQAAARASEAWSAYLPHLAIDASATHLSDNAPHNDRAYINDPELIKNDRYRADLTVDQLLFSLETLRSLKAATAETQLSQLNYSRGARDLELAVRLAYLDYLRAAEFHELYRRQRLLTDHTIELARVRMVTDEGPESDLNRFRLERLSQSNRILASHAQLIAARVLLNSLLNQPAGTPITLDTASASTAEFWRVYPRMRVHLATDRAFQRTQERLTATALQDNPSMQYSRSDIELQKRRLGQNWSRWFPTLGLRASLNLHDEYRDRPLLFEEKDNSWSIGALIHWSLFDGAGRTKEGRQLKARLSELEYLRDDVSLSVMREIGSLLARLASLGGQVATAERSYEMARNHISGILTRYSANENSYLESLDAAQLAQRAQEEAISFRIAYFESVARLLHEIGWSAHGENATPADLLLTRLAPQAAEEK